MSNMFSKRQKEQEQIARSTRSEALVAAPIPSTANRLLLAAPRVRAYTPHQGKHGSKVVITGWYLAGAMVFFGSQQARVLSSSSRELTVEVPPGSATKAVDLLIANRRGVVRIRNGFTVLPTPVTSFMFSPPINQTVKPSQLNQNILVLMVLPADGALPVGLTEADMHADLVAKLSGPDKCAGGFWQEATYGKTSLIFDVYDKVILLAENKYDYFHPSEPKRIEGVGASYPVTWAGGETLTLSSSSFVMTITFSGGTQSLAEVISHINAQILSAIPTDSPEPIIASSNSGQLWLESGAEGASAELDIAGGTALATLGLTAPVITPGIDSVDRRYDVFVEAMVKRTEGMSDSDAQTFLSPYAGVIVSYAVAEDLDYYRANSVTWTFNVRGGSFELGSVYITNGYPWQVFAHELGHTLGLPDLYDEPGLPELVGQELGNWDIMGGGWRDCHPSSWNKAVRSWRPGNTDPGYADPWMPASTMCIVNPPSALANVSRDTLLFPINAKLPSINPLAASHPGIPLVHAMRIDFDSNHAIYVEAREKGPYANSTLGAASYDSEIPSEGVIVTDAINDMTGIPVYRAYATLLTPYGNPINIAGESFTENVTAVSKLSVACTEVIGSDPAVYRVKVDWGPGSFFDLRIDPWQPPPWESRDIWVDTQVDNDWDEYTHSDPVANPDVAGYPVGNGDRLRVGWPARVYARVWNDGDRDVTNVKVDFSIVVPVGVGSGVSIGSYTIPRIPASKFGLAMIEWTPSADNGGHVCVQAAIEYQPGELNAVNNMAQENLVDWYIEGASPFVDLRFPFQVKNPILDRAHIRVQASGLRPGYYVEVEPVDFWLEPGEVKKGTARIHVDENVGYEDGKERRAPMVSLNFTVLHGCSWPAFGGLSGVIHAVRKCNLTARTLQDEKENDLVMIVDAVHAGGPVRGANVTVRITTPKGEVAILTRANTNNSGQARIPLNLPTGFPRKAEYRAEILLSPMFGCGPAETELTIRFPS